MGSPMEWYSPHRGRAIVEHCRCLDPADAFQRKLQEGSTGAELGPEGSDDASETWMVVDCMNYIVHFQDEKTRKASI
jgi:ribosomal silencing factor RsfS